MNYQQLEFTIEYLFHMMRQKLEGEHDPNKFLQFIYQYSIYFIGNRNYLVDYEEKRITMSGLLFQLKQDLIQHLRGPVASGPVASGPVASGPVASGPVAVPVAVAPAPVFSSGDLISDISKLIL
jgi:hypothetical protein